MDNQQLIEEIWKDIVGLKISKVSSTTISKESTLKRVET